MVSVTVTGVFAVCSTAHTVNAATFPECTEKQGAGSEGQNVTLRNEDSLGLSQTPRAHVL